MKRLLLISLLFAIVGTGCILQKRVKTDNDIAGMVYVAPGSFVMGNSEKDGLVGTDIGVDTIPQYKVYLKGYFIDKYEVTVKEYRKFVNDTNRDPPCAWTDITMIPMVKDEQPVNDVSWFDADAYCRWAGKRLPTEEEWEKAAKWPDGRYWPWGNNFDNKKANTEESGNVWVVPGGTYIEDISPYGVYDMAGNAAEWTSSWYKPYPGTIIPNREDFGEKLKVVKGGAWDTPIVYSRIANRNYYYPIAAQPTFGFRCARN